MLFFSKPRLPENVAQEVLKFSLVPLRVRCSSRRGPVRGSFRAAPIGGAEDECTRSALQCRADALVRIEAIHRTQPNRAVDQQIKFIDIAMQVTKASIVDAQVVLSVSNWEMPHIAVVAKGMEVDRRTEVELVDCREVPDLANKIAESQGRTGTVPFDHADRPARGVPGEGAFNHCQEDGQLDACNAM